MGTWGLSQQSLRPRLRQGYVSVRLPVGRGWAGGAGAWCWAPPAPPAYRGQFAPIQWWLGMGNIPSPNSPAAQICPNVQHLLPSLPSHRARGGSPKPPGPPHPLLSPGEAAQRRALAIKHLRLLSFVKAKWNNVISLLQLKWLDWINCNHPDWS